MRTSLGLVAAGVATIQFVDDFGVSWSINAIGLFLILLGTAAAPAGLRRWLMVRRAMETGSPMPQSLELWVVAAGIGAVGLAAAAIAVIGVF